MESNNEKEIFIESSKSLQIEMSKPSANSELNQRVLDGDITTHKKYKKMLDHYTLKEMIDNQPLAEYAIYVNSTKQQLQRYNKSVLLDENQYLEGFERG